jgi:hypothetical protein
LTEEEACSTRETRSKRKAKGGKIYRIDRSQTNRSVEGEAGRIQPTNQNKKKKAKRGKIYRYIGRVADQQE